MLNIFAKFIELMIFLMWLAQDGHNQPFDSYVHVLLIFYFFIIYFCGKFATLGIYCGKWFLI